MYTLRIVQESMTVKDQPFQSLIENFELGDAYAVIKKNDSCEFDDIMNRLFPEWDASDIEKIVCAENGKTFFVFENNELRNNAYFIMTESGKTFEKL